ncbi:serine hydrolase domain-containing protein [Alkalimonas sp. NCh-2]|uniref:serine hydrolase domain-containing protein n=1 Tax=Alkalimonas sp. NCh-2 TaxID=3144846 RepID=UPI0031F6D978
MKFVVLIVSAVILQFSTQANEAESIREWAAIESLVQERGFNGSIVIAKGEQVLFHQNFGYADAAASIPLTSKHVFSPGSVGKEFTTISMMQLAASNKLTYQDKITDYIDGLPAWASEITIEHVLTHTSGLPAVQWKKHISTADAVQQIQQGQPVFEPGAGYHYTNLNVVVRALIVERITGKSYSDSVVDTIFKVAGMTDSFHQTDRQPAANTVVAGDFPTHMAGLTIYVTPLDLYKFERALWNGSLVKAEQLRQVLEGDRLSGQQNRAYFDFGRFMLDQDGTLLSWEHDGSNPSHHTIKHHDFITGSIVVLMSSDGNKSTLYQLLHAIQAVKL